VSLCLSLGYVFLHPDGADKINSGEITLFWKNVLSFNPLVRLPEFVVGMLAGRLFLVRGEKTKFASLLIFTGLLGFVCVVLFADKIPNPVLSRACFPPPSPPSSTAPRNNPGGPLFSPRIPRLVGRRQLQSVSSPFPPHRACIRFLSPLRLVRPSHTFSLRRHCRFNPRLPLRRTTRPPPPPPQIAVRASSAYFFSLRPL